MFSDIETIRFDRSKNIDKKTKSQFSQYFTPGFIARYMAGLFDYGDEESYTILDPGAGTGILSCAFLETIYLNKKNSKHVELIAYEIDKNLNHDLNKAFSIIQNKFSYKYEIINIDFIEKAVSQIQLGIRPFTHIILNPPYKKIDSHSRTRLLLRLVGIETVNMYSAFVGLSLALLKPGGQLIAIVPRSFCNGPYYRPFRDYILDNSAIEEIFIFKSRTKAFRDDNVLQENVIIKLIRDRKQGDVKVSTSSDDSLLNIESNIYKSDRIIIPDSKDRFINIPLTKELNPIEKSSTFSYSLSEIGLSISTGPIVDFRMKNFLSNEPEKNSVPLIYASHFTKSDFQWPKLHNKKPNSILHNHETMKFLFPVGFYCLVRRFSSKEEPRRVIAYVLNPEKLNDYEYVGFENHLNVFHFRKKGLSENLAFGLFTYLNSTAVDSLFRTFNGHTQVNATDLRSIKYPSRECLEEIGAWAKKNNNLTQQNIDTKINSLIK